MAEAARVKTGEAVKSGEFGFPTGHLGHLTEQQQLALVEFKEICASANVYTPKTEGKAASHDDATMLRFLRARRFNPNDALQQFRDTENWRKVNQITDLYNNIDVGEYEQTRRLYPQWTGRRDKRGIPVYVFEVAPLNSKTMSAYAKSVTKTHIPNYNPIKSKEAETVSPRLLRLFALYENLCEFAMPLCTKLADRPNPETPISQSNNIVDISGVGLKQFWNLRDHMQDASVLATAHYPETLDRIFIVGAPSFFPTVWSWIKRWFDPITVSKIFILSQSNAYQTLSEFIDPQNIPQKYGGQLKWQWDSPPLLDPAEREHLHFVEGHTDWPTGPLRWVWKDEMDDKWQLLEVGSVGGKQRRNVVATFDLDNVRVSRTTTNTDALPPHQSSGAGVATTSLPSRPRTAEQGGLESVSSAVHSDSKDAAAGQNLTMSRMSHDAPSNQTQPAFLANGIPQQPAQGPQSGTPGPATSSLPSFSTITPASVSTSSHEGATNRSLPLSDMQETMQQSGTAHAPGPEPVQAPTDSSFSPPQVTSMPSHNPAQTSGGMSHDHARRLVDLALGAPVNTVGIHSALGAERAVEPALLPPVPLITPDVPLGAIANDLPAVTDGEKRALGHGSS